jgi:hypothetical protein
MSVLGITFLVLMILWFFFGFFIWRVPGENYPVERGGAHLLLWGLLAILGYQVFGHG